MPEQQPETVSLDSITNTPVSAPPNGGQSLPRDIDPFTGQRDHKLDQHLGRVGAFIGGGPEKAGNIAYIVIITSIILLIMGGVAAAYVGSEKLASIYDRIVTGAFSLITGALGFLFGKGGGASSKD